MESLFSKTLAEFLKTSNASTEKLSAHELEEIYFSAIRSKDLEKLGLPCYLAPQHGRGLPKQYAQTDPNIFQVKKKFSNAVLLRLMRIEKAIFFLYSQQKTFEDSKITLMTWVISDGMGDYFAQLEAANILIEKFPHVSLISILHKNSPMMQLHPKCPHNIIRYSGATNHPIIHEAFSDELMEKLSQSDLILEVPTAFPYMQPLLSELKTRNPDLKYQRIGEHSLIESIDFDPSSGARCMGLHPFEMGIFSKKKSFVRYPIQQLQYKPLLKLLFSSDLTSIESYVCSHSFNVAYTKTIRGTYLYLHMLCKGLVEDSKNIDLCFFKLELMLKVLNDRFKKGGDWPLFKNWKIGKILIYTQDYVIPIAVSNELKTLRMVHCPSLAQQDLQILFSFTDRLIGCTGDQTLCEAICSGVPFFYDPPPFKRAILKDLLILSKSRLHSDTSLERLFELLLKNPHICPEDSDGEWVSEDYILSERDRLSLREDDDEKIGDALASLICKPEFKDGFLKLRDLLQGEYSFDEILKGIVNRHLFHQRCPALMQWELNALNQFSIEKETGVDFLSLLKEKMNDIHLNF